MDKRALRGKLLITYLMSFLGFCLLLFWPAGTLAYWQGWLYIAVFLGLGLVVSLILLRDDPALLASRMTFGPLSEPDPAQKLIQCAAAVLFMALLILCGADYSANGPRFSAVASVLAVAALGLGGYPLYLVLKENGYAASTIRIQSGQRVISTGPYAYIRHPMYSWAVFFFLVTPPALASVWGFAASPLICAAIAFRLLREERYLRANLPGYTEYCEKARYRLLPFVW